MVLHRSGILDQFCWCYSLGVIISNHKASSHLVCLCLCWFFQHHDVLQCHHYMTIEWHVFLSYSCVQKTQQSWNKELQYTSIYAQKRSVLLPLSCSDAMLNSSRVSLSHRSSSGASPVSETGYQISFIIFWEMSEKERNWPSIPLCYFLCSVTMK